MYYIIIIIIGVIYNNTFIIKYFLCCIYIAPLQDELIWDGLYANLNDIWGH